MTSVRNRSRLRKGEGEQLRREILAATRDLLAEKGSHDLVSIRDIAHRVGVSPPSIYLHFETKDQLTYAVCREAFEGFGARLLPILAGKGDALDRLRRVGEAYIRWGLDNAALYPVLFLGEPPESMEHEVMAGDPGLLVLAGLVALVRLGMDEGAIRGGSTPEATAWAMWAAVHGTVLLLSSKREWMQSHLAEADTPIGIPGVDELIETVIEAVFRAFSPADG
ncbi:TetR/AcrR family transcriptional regulator [soil metagenome]